MDDKKFRWISNDSWFWKGLEWIFQRKLWIWTYRHPINNRCYICRSFRRMMLKTTHVCFHHSKQEIQHSKQFFDSKFYGIMIKISAVRNVRLYLDVLYMICLAKKNFEIHSWFCSLLMNDCEWGQSAQVPHTQCGRTANLRNYQYRLIFSFWWQDIHFPSNSFIMHWSYCFLVLSIEQLKSVLKILQF